MDEPKANKLDILSDDRISLLPEPILHHILCFLSQKEAIKTCLLSKPWRYLSCTRPIIKYIGNKDSLDSPAFMDRMLQGCHDRNFRLDEFTLWLSKDYVDPDGIDMASVLLNKWIPIIIHHMHVKTLRLGLNSRPQLFEMPSLILESNHNIRTLYLLRCMLKISTAEVRVELKRLHTLYLFEVCIPEQVLDSILSNCPLIWKLSLMYCKGFKRIKLSNNNNKPTNIEHFNFCGCEDNKVDYVSIEIGNDIQTLRTVKLAKCLFSISRNKPLEFARLKLLTLTSVQLSCESFSCNLHCLEELKLNGCSGIKEFKLSSRSMKRLTINNIGTPFKATIDAPSMVSFNYEGILPQSISFATTSGDDHLWKSKINLGSLSTFDNHDPAHCFNELYGLLQALSQSEITLELDQNEIHRLWRQLDIGSTNDHDDIVGVSEEAKHELPVAVEHLRIMCKESRNVYSVATTFLNMLFHMFRPSFVYMGTGMLTYSNYKRSCEIAELLLKEIETTIQERYICRRVLEGVGLQALYQNQSEWQTVEHTSFTELCKKSADSKELELCFHLKWKN